MAQLLAMSIFCGKSCCKRGEWRKLYNVYVIQCYMYTGTGELVSSPDRISSRGQGANKVWERYKMSRGHLRTSKPRNVYPSVITGDLLLSEIDWSFGNVPV